MTQQPKIQGQEKWINLQKLGQSTDKLERRLNLGQVYPPVIKLLRDKNELDDQKLSLIDSTINRKHNKTNDEVFYSPRQQKYLQNGSTFEAKANNDSFLQKNFSTSIVNRYNSNSNSASSTGSVEGEVSVQEMREKIHGSIMSAREYNNHRRIEYENQL